MPDRRHLAVRHLAALLRLEKAFAAAVEQALAALTASARRQLRDRLDAAVLDTRDPAWTAAVAKHIDPQVIDVYVAGMRRLTDTGTFDAQPYAVRYLESVHDRLVGTAEGVFDDVREELIRGQRRGESIPELAARVDVVLGDSERWANRATVIARTEVIAANNAGAHDGAGVLADALGVDRALVVKEWLATPDDRTRETHRHAGGEQVLGLDALFTVGDARMPVPGWPFAPAGEVIQCRCSCLYLMPGDPGYPDGLTAGGTVDYHQAMSRQIALTEKRMKDAIDHRVGVLVAAGTACTDHPCVCIGCDTFDCGLDGCACCWTYNDADVAVLSPRHPDDAKVAALTSAQLATFDVSTMPEKLQDYWLHGAGAAIIGWDTPGDFARCQAALRGKVPGHMIDGTCANLHSKATGHYPGKDKGNTVEADTYATDPTIPPGETPTEVDPNECTCCAGSGTHDCPHPCVVCSGEGTLDAQTAGPTGEGVDDYTDGDPLVCEGHHGMPDPCDDTDDTPPCVHTPDHFDPDSAPAGTPTFKAPDAPAPVTAAAPEQTVDTEAATETPLTWSGVLAPEGVQTGDKRKFSEGAIQWMGTPGVLKAMFTDQPGHDGSVPVGLIESIERVDGQLVAHGTWDTGPAAIEARRQNIAGLLRGVSVDLDDPQSHMEDADGNVIDGDAMFDLTEEPTFVVDKARLRSATLWCIPAFVEAYVLDATVADQIPDTSLVTSTATPLAMAAAAAYTTDDLTADAAPASAFADPGFDGPTKLTVTDDGRVFGHLACWGVCHIGIEGACVTPPHSATGYAYYLTGDYPTSDGGHVPVGALTLGTGHADLTLGWRPTVDHYDNTGTVAAYVNVGEDDHGIWFAGVLAEDLPLPQRHALTRSGSVSGDWRAIGGNLELVANLGVNVPGFPIPATRSMAAAGAQQALVASGVVPVAPEPATPPTVAELAREVAAFQARQTRREAAAARVRTHRRAAAASRLTGKR